MPKRKPPKQPGKPQKPIKSLELHTQKKPAEPLPAGTIVAVNRTAFARGHIRRLLEEGVPASEITPERILNDLRRVKGLTLKHVNRARCELFDEFPGLRKRKPKTYV